MTNSGPRVMASSVGHMMQDVHDETSSHLEDSMVEHCSKISSEYQIGCVMVCVEITSVLDCFKVWVGFQLFLKGRQKMWILHVLRYDSDVSLREINALYRNAKAIETAFESEETVFSWCVLLHAQSVSLHLQNQAHVGLKKSISLKGRIEQYNSWTCQNIGK